MKIMPIRETVAGEACCRLSVSKRKLTLVPNWMRSPEGIVSRRLSSSTEFSASIHSGSMSPSQTIQRCTEVSLITWISRYFLETFEMDVFSTHLSSSHSDDSILPFSRVHIHVSEQLQIRNLLSLWEKFPTFVRLMALGLNAIFLTAAPDRTSARCSTFQIVLFPEPGGPTMTTPIRCRSCS